MDPSKSPSAPSQDWNPDSKSGMTNPAPPPYQEYPQYPAAGYPPAGQPAPGMYPPAQQYGGAPSPYPPQPGMQYPPGPGQGQYPQGAQHMVTVQPTVYVTQTPLIHPKPDYLGYSIFTMLCCCLPLGIAALVYSIRTRDANHQGQQQKAEMNSRTARNLNHAALGIGIALIILYIVYAAVIANRFN
ncbi:cysteine-rich and transmembrane domain-containing protein 1-like [Anguilla anguilla]|uniref:cysteine-rich and transmembrane domain-containing protein 1-like n=1 Tax=Anguilla anguilla TaxID=7936 RepID=UPI0015A9D889|nr:cysteine-rich and transmembrane domain-containing protein 1-like [Anguilla anguilla]